MNEPSGSVASGSKPSKAAQKRKRAPDKDPPPQKQYCTTCQRDLGSTGCRRSMCFFHCAQAGLCAHHRRQKTPETYQGNTQQVQYVPPSGNVPGQLLRTDQGDLRNSQFIVPSGTSDVAVSVDSASRESTPTGSASTVQLPGSQTASIAEDLMRLMQHFMPPVPRSETAGSQPMTADELARKAGQRIRVLVLSSSNKLLLERNIQIWETWPYYHLTRENLRKLGLPDRDWVGIWGGVRGWVWVEVPYVIQVSAGESVTLAAFDPTDSTVGVTATAPPNTVAMPSVPSFPVPAPAQPEPPAEEDDVVEISRPPAKKKPKAKAAKNQPAATTSRRHITEEWKDSIRDKLKAAQLYEARCKPLQPPAASDRPPSESQSDIASQVDWEGSNVPWKWPVQPVASTSTLYPSEAQSNHASQGTRVEPAQPVASTSKSRSDRPSEVNLEDANDRETRIESVLPPIFPARYPSKAQSDHASQGRRAEPAYWSASASKAQSDRPSEVNSGGANVRETRIEPVPPPVTSARYTSEAQSDRVGEGARFEPAQPLASTSKARSNRPSDVNLGGAIVRETRIEPVLPPAAVALYPSEAQSHHASQGTRGEPAQPPASTSKAQSNRPNEVNLRGAVVRETRIEPVLPPAAVARYPSEAQSHHASQGTRGEPAQPPASTSKAQSNRPNEVNLRGAVVRETRIEPVLPPAAAARYPSEAQGDHASQGTRGEPAQPPASTSKAQSNRPNEVNLRGAVVRETLIEPVLPPAAVARYPSEAQSDHASQGTRDEPAQPPASTFKARSNRPSEVNFGGANVRETHTEPVPPPVASARYTSEARSDRAGQASGGANIRGTRVEPNQPPANTSARYASHGEAQRVNLEGTSVRVPIRPPAGPSARYASELEARSDSDRASQVNFNNASVREPHVVPVQPQASDDRWVARQRAGSTPEYYMESNVRAEPGVAKRRRITESSSDTPAVIKRRDSLQSVMSSREMSVASTDGGVHQYPSIESPAPE